MNSPARPTPPRYSDRTFPPYRFIPGKSPHPTRDPDGHSYHNPVQQLASFDDTQWQGCDEYLFGIDLFNHGYWWEAHEALEAVWVAAGRQTETGLFIQGLIQVAVAHLKKFQGFDDVARRMGADGLEKMKHIKGVYLGINVEAFRNDVKSYSTNDKHPPVTIALITE
jgi:uncharacterized protein